MKYCKNCGAKLDLKTSYCSNCGTKLDSKQSSQGGNNKAERLSPLNTYKHSLKSYFRFEGRSSLREYWNFVLFNILFSIVFAFIDMFFGLYSYEEQNGVFSTIFSLFIVIPTISVGVRRMHDIGKRGLWILFPLVNLIFALTKGDEGENKYGEEPTF